MERLLSHTVTDEQHGLSLGVLLRQHLSIGAAQLTRLKQTENGITVNNIHQTVRYIVQSGDVVTLKLNNEVGNFEEIIPIFGKLDIVFEDSDLLVVNKPSGVAVHPSRGHYTDTLANAVAYYLKDSDTPFVFRSINRLDRGTSGLLCIAKNQLAASRLSRAIGQEKAIKRTYLALLCGNLVPQSGTIDLPIKRKDGFGIMRGVAQDGSRAVTHYTVLSRGNGYSLTEIVLETGRTHQIRVHFSHLGHPVASDFMYGKELDGVCGFALHSYKMEFAHPFTGKLLQLTSPMPPLFDELMKI